MSDKKKQKPTKDYVVNQCVAGEITYNVGDKIPLNEDQLPGFINAGIIDAPEGYIEMVEKAVKTSSKDSAAPVATVVDKDVKSDPVKKTLSKMNVTELEVALKALEGVKPEELKKALALKPKNKMVAFIKSYKAPKA